MKKKDLIAHLKVNETLATRLAEEHGEQCPIGQIARAVRDGCHELLAGEGPAQVATDEYRANWDTIFGKKQIVGEA